MDYVEVPQDKKTYDCDPLIYDSASVRPAYSGYAPLSTETTAGLKQGPLAMSFAKANKIYASLSCKPLAKKKEVMSNET